jgi:peptidyl-prolyl cis-trans isomerase SurA
MAAAVLGFGQVAQAEERLADRIAAVVDDTVITVSEVYVLGSNAIDEQCPDPFDAMCRAEMEGLVLDILVRRALQQGELDRLGYDITPADVESTLEQIVTDNRLGSRAALRAEIEDSEVTWEDYIADLESQLRGARFQDVVLRSRITLVEDELQSRYAQWVREQPRPDVVKIEGFAFVVPDGLDADAKARLLSEIAAEVAVGSQGAAQAAALIATRDTGKASRLLGSRAFGPGELAGPLGAVAFDTPVGAWSSPVWIDGRVWALHVLAREPGPVDAPPFEAVRAQVEEQLYQEKLQEAEETWYLAARRRAALKVLMPGVTLPAPASAP